MPRRSILNLNLPLPSDPVVLPFLSLSFGPLPTARRISVYLTILLLQTIEVSQHCVAPNSILSRTDFCLCLDTQSNAVVMFGEPVGAANGVTWSCRTLGRRRGRSKRPYPCTKGQERQKGRCKTLFALNECARRHRHCTRRTDLPRAKMVDGCRMSVRRKVAKHGAFLHSWVPQYEALEPCWSMSLSNSNAIGLQPTEAC